MERACDTPSLMIRRAALTLSQAHNGPLSGEDAMLRDGVGGHEALRPHGLRHFVVIPEYITGTVKAAYLRVPVCLAHQLVLYLARHPVMREDVYKAGVDMLAFHVDDVSISRDAYPAADGFDEAVP
jgi:hypothetical protein